MKSLLIGQSAQDETREEIRRMLVSRPEIEELLNLITLQLGPQIMVAIKARMRPEVTAEGMVASINLCEAALKERFPDVRWVFFEPDLSD